MIKTVRSPADHCVVGSDRTVVHSGPTVRLNAGGASGSNGALGKSWSHVVRYGEGLIKTVRSPADHCVVGSDRTVVLVSGIHGNVCACWYVVLTMCIRPRRTYNRVVGLEHTVVSVSGRDGFERTIGVGWGGSATVTVSPAGGRAIGPDRTAVVASGRDGNECARWFAVTPIVVITPPAFNCAIGSDRTAVDDSGGHGKVCARWCLKPHVVLFSPAF